jgi:hypothetical protein
VPAGNEYLLQYSGLSAKAGWLIALLSLVIVALISGLICLIACKKKTPIAAVAR